MRCNSTGRQWFYPGDTLGGDASNWWGPNRLLMYHLLTELGFKTIMYSENVVNHQRGVYHAFLEEDDFFALADPQAQAVWSDLRLVMDSESSNPSAEKRDEDLKRELIALRADVGELKRELKVLRRSSWSWQLGKPIRRMRAKAGSAKPPPVGKYGGAC